MAKRYKHRQVSIAGEAKIQSDRKLATSDRFVSICTIAVFELGWTGKHVLAQSGGFDA